MIYQALIIIGFVFAVAGDPIFVNLFGAALIAAGIAIQPKGVN